MKRVGRILILLPSAGFGGAERHTLCLAQGLAARGVEIALAADKIVAKRLSEEPMQNPAVAISAADLRWDEADANGSEERQYRVARALIREFRPDSVIVPLPWPTFAPGIQLALDFCGTPALMITHLAPREPVRADIRNADLAEWHGRRVWVAVSQPMARRVEVLLGLTPCSVGTIPNAVRFLTVDEHRRISARRAVRHALGLSARARLILFAGRLDWGKGADLLPSIASLMADQADTTIVCAGEGPLDSTLADWARGNCGSVLRPVGYQKDLVDWILASDVLLLPSRHEGCPLVFLEAASLGCPVVATDAALECLGENGSSIALIAPSEDVRGLATALRRVTSSSPLAKDIAAAARKHVESYSVSDMLEHYFSLIRLLHVT